MTEIQQQTMNREDAERLTERIRMVATSFMETRDKLSLLIRQAQEGQAHEALGFPSWTAYIAQVFSDTPLMRLTRDERRVIVADLSEQGMSTKAIAPVVGVSFQQVSKDRLAQGSPQANPGSPVEPTFDETPDWDPVGATYDVATRTVTPGTVTGMDGKTYPRPEQKESPEPAKPRRRPITDQFFDAAYDLRKNIERIERLITDDRFPQNREQVALKHQSDLSRASTALAKVIDALNN